MAFGLERRRHVAAHDDLLALEGEEVSENSWPRTPKLL